MYVENNLAVTRYSHTTLQLQHKMDKTIEFFNLSGQKLMKFHDIENNLAVSRYSPVMVPEPWSDSNDLFNRFNFP